MIEELFSNQSGGLRETHPVSTAFRDHRKSFAEEEVDDGGSPYQEVIS